MTDLSFSHSDYSTANYPTLVSDSYAANYAATPIAVVTSTKRLAKTIKNTPLRSMPVPDVMVDDSRDDLLTPFSKATLKDRYLTEDESYQDRFANCVRYYANDADHAQRLYDYISKLWCMPPTPILSNGGTIKGNLISCFINDMPDSLEGIVGTWNENIWMGAKGGGIGTYVGDLREIGGSVASRGKTSGCISFVKVIDSLTACISQAGNRRGAAAVYMDISHPEIDSFIELRNESGGDPNRKAHNLYHGVCISDAFMKAVQNDADWDLISPKTGKVIETVRAQDLMIKILQTRMNTGTPYIFFSDTVARATPEHHKRSGLVPHTSNLCIEITLPTGIDHRGEDRTAVCCLFQPNAEKFDEWKDNDLFFKDIAYFLDNVLQDFIDNAGEHFVKARYSAMRERSIGVGMMGFHSFLQSKQLPYEGVMAKVWNKKIFTRLKTKMDEASRELAEERGACPDAAEHGIMERFSYKTAIAPTASVSIICGGTSAGIDIIPANVFTQKTLDGSFEVKNLYLQKVLASYGKDTRTIWNSITDKQGSVQHLDFMTQDERDVFKTSFEVDQRYHIEYAADRAPMIDQSQSLNVSLRPEVDKRDLWKLHELAWKLGVKTMYYLRSMSVNQVNSTSGNSLASNSFNTVAVKAKEIDYDSCTSCQ